MFPVLFLLLTVVPIIELALLIWIGGQTAWWVPVLTVVLTGIAGAMLARWQRSRALQRIQDDLRTGRMPTEAVVDGVLILIAAILLVTPGVLSDFVGLGLLVPPARSLLKRGAFAWFRRNMTVRATHFAQGVHFEATPRQYGTTAGDDFGDEIIEAKVLGTRVESAE